MVNALEALFPGLRATSYRVTSPPTRDYNCIAWATGDALNWWWPVGDPFDEPRFWPTGVAREVTLAAFLAAFTSVGYGPCDNTILESGFDKIAVFADQGGRPTHACRQIEEGRWTSKLGRSEDVEHELHAPLEGDTYGRIVLVMKRPRAAIAAPP
jgi:hypothetical protein